MRPVLLWCKVASSEPIAAVRAAERPRWIRSAVDVVLAAGLGIGTLGGCSSPSHHSRTRVTWVRRYNGPGNYKDLPVAVAISPDGHTVFVTGRSAGNNLTADYATIAYDTATGSRRWVSRYSGPGKGPDTPTAISVSPDGGVVFITGMTAPRNQDHWASTTIAYNSADGSRLWLSNSADFRSISVRVSPDGHTVFVTGTGVSDSGTRSVFLTFAYQATNGNVLWSARYSSPGGGDATPTNLAVSPDGRTVYVTGISLSARGANGSATVAYDAASGKQFWVRRTITTTWAMTLSLDGRLVVLSGSVVGSANEHRRPRYYTSAYDAATGIRRWMRLYPENGDQPGASAAVSSTDGRMVFVTGCGPRRHHAASCVTATAAYSSATGRPVWVNRDDSSSGGEAVAVSPDGRTIYVTSTTPAGHSRLDDIVLAYRAATGTLLWTRKYAFANALSYDFNDSGAFPVNHDEQIAISPDGRTVVTIEASAKVRHNPDYLTIAYRA